MIGLKGKDIKAYTSQTRLYIHSAEIRHKLGLTENDTNLTIHMRNMHEKRFVKLFSRHRETKFSSQQ